MPDRSPAAVRGREVERLLREGLTRIATADEAALPAILEEVEALLVEMEEIRSATVELLPWSPDGAERLDACRTELRKLQAGRVRRRDAVAKIRLLLPRFAPSEG